MDKHEQCKDCTSYQEGQWNKNIGYCLEWEARVNGDDDGCNKFEKWVGVPSV